MYDPLVAKAYYSKYPLLVAKRTLQLLKYSNRFLFNILVDKYIRRDQQGTYNKERAAELLDLINKAGPTAIKVTTLFWFLFVCILLSLPP
jgi:predicted unusual protein kinase regulating ubiquinone biosynthesis (AarF/ABC1/UbiB family)